MAASVEEFVELLSSEQHVDLVRLRHLARHGVHPAVRGEVWMYLLGVLSPDKSHEMTSVRALYNTYDGLLSSCSQPYFFSPRVSQLIRQEAERIWRHRVPHQSRSSCSEQQTSATGSHIHSFGLPKVKEGALDDGSSLPTDKTSRRNIRGPLWPIRALNADHVTRSESRSESSSGKGQTAFCLEEQEEVTGEEEAKQHFVKRVHNVVSVWIGQKSVAQRDANKLHNCLRNEATSKPQGQPRRPVSPSEIKGREHSPQLFDATESLPAPSLPSQASSTGAYPGHSEERLKITSEEAYNEQHSRTPRAIQQQQQQHAWTDDNVAQDMLLFRNRRREETDARDHNVDGADSEEEPFDPAMGMGVENDEDFGYPDDVASLEGAMRNQIRADDQRVVLRSAQDGESDEEESGVFPSGADHGEIEVSKLRENDDDATEESLRVVVGLDVPAQRRSKHGVPSNPQEWKARSHSRFHSSGGPKSPHSGYTSPHRLRVGHLGSLSPRPRSHDSRSSVESDEDDDEGDRYNAAKEVDEGLMKIQEALWQPHLVQLASPFVLISGEKRVEAGIFFAFDKLMTLIETRRKAFPLSHLLATFHTLLRRTLPELRAYFDDEGLDVTPFVKGWLESLFSGQMRLSEGGCLRLWDAYFSSLPAPTPATDAVMHMDVQSVVVPDTGAVLPPVSSTPLSLHLYVCLAILLHCKDTLEELDRSECESFLRGLPNLDVEKILNEAANLRLSHRQSILICGEGEGDIDVDGFGEERVQDETQRAIWMDFMVEEETGGEDGPRTVLEDSTEGTATDVVSHRSHLTM